MVGVITLGTTAVAWSGSKGDNRGYGSGDSKGAVGMEYLCSYHFPGARRVRIDPINERIAVFGKNGLEVMNLGADLRVTTMYPCISRQNVRSAIFLDDGSSVAIAVEDQRVARKEINSGMTLQSFGSEDDLELAYGSLFCLKETLFAAAVMREQSDAYNLMDGKLIKRYRRCLFDFKLHPEGKLISHLVSGYAQTPIGFICAGSLLPFRDIFDPAFCIDGYAFSPDGSILAAHGTFQGESLLVALNFPTIETLYQLQFPIPDRLLQQPGLLQCDWLGYSRDGKDLLYIDPYGRMRQINALSGAERGVHVLAGEHVISADARYDLDLLATLGQEGSVHLWRLGFEGAAPAHALQGLSGDFSRESEVIAPDSESWEFERHILL